MILIVGEGIVSSVFFFCLGTQKEEVVIKTKLKNPINNNLQVSIINNKIKQEL